MNFQLAAIIVLIIIYPLGYWVAKTGKSPLIGVPVLLIFLATAIYLLISAWLILLMMIGTGILFMMGTASFDAAAKAKLISGQMEEDEGAGDNYLKGRVKPAIFIGLILVGGSIFLFILSIVKSLG